MNTLLQEYTMAYHAAMWLISVIAYLRIAWASHHCASQCPIHLGRYSIAVALTCAITRFVTGGEALLGWCFAVRSTEEALHQLYGTAMLINIGFLVAITVSIFHRRKECKIIQAHAAKVRVEIQQTFEALQDASNKE